MKKECHIKEPNFGGPQMGTQVGPPTACSNQLNPKNPNWKAEAKLKGIHHVHPQPIH